jgi:hypothetical protein
VGASDLERLEQRRNVAGHALVGERARSVAGATVALELDRHDLEVAGERGQQLGEAALDRAEGAVEQDERRAFAVALVVKLDRADVDVARGRRPHACVR